MGKLKCLCGEILSNVADPSKNNGWLLKDVDLEDAVGWEASDIICKAAYVWECHNCGRIAINNSIGFVKWYKPEDGLPGNITKF